ncbi:MAG: hypothetical protein U1F35_07600 [Steroidobacteraceae bacterium]
MHGISPEEIDRLMALDALRDISPISFNSVLVNTGKKLVLIDAGEVARTKRLGVFSEVAGTDIALAGAHLAFPGFGHLRAEGSGFRWIPIPFELAGPR